MAGQKKIPMRKCIVSGEMRPKKELIRIVRTSDGVVVIDPSGKKSGRGAYISLDRELILKAKKKNILTNHLKVAIEHSLYDELLELVEKEGIR